MFKKFIELFSSENLLDAAYNTSITMLEFDFQMYEASRKTLRETDTTELPFDIKSTDRKINKFEREVRRKVLTHLTISGTSNLIPGLALITIVIDVERIGDFTKNIYDLASHHRAKLQGYSYESSLQKLEEILTEIFPKAIQILKDHDKDIGREIMQYEKAFSEKSDGILYDLIQERDPKVPIRDAVALALYARYLKRIDAHLTNIASGIVNPFHRIGFREKGQKPTLDLDLD